MQKNEQKDVKQHYLDNKNNFLLPSSRKEQQGTTGEKIKKRKNTKKVN